MVRISGMKKIQILCDPGYSTVSALRKPSMKQRRRILGPGGRESQGQGCTENRSQTHEISINQVPFGTPAAGRIA